MTTRYVVVGVLLRRAWSWCFGSTLAGALKHLTDAPGRVSQTLAVLRLWVQLGEIVRRLVALAAHQAKVHQPFVADASVCFVVDF